MDKLQWFKFSHIDWMMGKIQRCPEVTQARFIKLVCLYWNKECNLSLEDSIIEIDKEHIDILISKKVISINDEHIFIDFLDEQMDNILETSKKNSKAGKKSAALRKANSEQVFNDRSTTVQRNSTDKIREEETRKDKIRIRKDISSFFDDKIKEYKLDVEKVYLELDAALDYYADNGWRNRDNKEVKNFKSTIWNNWFKNKLSDFKKKIVKLPTERLTF